MKWFFHLAIFFLLYGPIAFIGQVIGHTFSLHIDGYGLWVLAALCTLTRWDSVCSMILLGLWLDALQPNVDHFGLQSLWLSVTVWVCQKPSWRLIFEAHLRIMAAFFQTVLQFLSLGCLFALHQVPITCLSSYFPSWLVSTLLCVILIKPLLSFQRKYLE